ncbi:NAD(P)-dependent oxidoreductase [Ruficoccus amylovorans]|uniref:NAD(P)-dependent oxidoreductase n=1 Tax=Ruficoccus amylovorans TaxID=1804625 RepID=A0A842HHY3_9BACT|nr:NAD(P)-dependent oxidoreductase [Ruficoccus amylovorans]MBC2595780.1 NAD(P)-dependent oxidoreductase [Ruficoccus amylovorans]
MKNILLTGGSGFIGKNILESPLASRYEITAPARAELDLTDTGSVDAFFHGKSFDCVLHAGVKPGHRNAPDHSRLLYSNLRMFENLERHRDHYGRFLNFGSGAIYGTAGDISGATEADIFTRIPEDEHGFCKHIVGKRIEQLPGFIDLVIFGIFGRYEDFEIRFISNAICKAIHGLPITLRQNRRFSYIDVADLMPVLEFFIEGEPRHRFYNIVGSRHLELARIAEIVRETAGAKAEVQIQTPGYGKDYYGSNARLLAEHALRETPIEESIARLYRHYYDNRNRIDPTLLAADK